MRLASSVLACTALALMSSPALAAMQFINPPQFRSRVLSDNYPVRYIGDTVNIRWTAGPSGKKLSVVLYQVNTTKAATYDGSFHSNEGTAAFEFITHDQIDETQTTWIVTTTKNFAANPMFAIAVWLEGAGRTDSATDIFNISAPLEQTTSQTSTRLPASPTLPLTFSPSPSSATTDSAQRNIPADSSSSNSETTKGSSSNGLSAGQSAGIGIGVGAAVVLVAAAAFYWLWRRRAASDNIPVQKVAASLLEKPVSSVELPKDVYYEAPTTAPASELGAGVNLSEMRAPTTRHELPD